MRERALIQFLSRYNWLEAERIPLTGDASRRKYLRLIRREQCKAILMDAPPDICGFQDSFLSVAQHLKGIGLSAPAIIASDRENGFILMEDLGDALFAIVAKESPELLPTMYDVAMDGLAVLRTAPVPNNLRPYTAVVQAELAILAFEWYGQRATGKRVNSKFLSQLVGELRRLISDLGAPEVFTHRDFHAENLIWLPERKGVQRVGVLDFQDAMRFHPAYDLVSLLEDARFDVDDCLRQRCIRSYCNNAGEDECKLLHELAVCGTQRNLRIIGVFTRLALRDGKLQYLQLLPRVWQNLKRDLSHPALANIADLVSSALPPPTTSILKNLETRQK